MSTIHAVTQNPVAHKRAFKIMALVYVVRLHVFNTIMDIVMTVELSIKSLKEGQNYGLDPSLKNLSITSLSVRHVSKCALKVGWKF